MPAERRPDRLPLRRRLPPAVALLLLAPWAAECSWGGFTADEFLLVVLVLAPMYGGAALLIRETARHLGAGWPAIVLLAAAFGVVQAGLVDQSLFNPDFLDDTGFADTQAAAEATRVPGLGFSARQAVDYVGNHVLLSICAPIALVESYLGAGRRLRPWLGRPGLAVVALLYLAGSALIFSDVRGSEGFLASPVQLAFAAALALALIGTALLPRWRHRPRPSEPPGQDAPAFTPVHAPQPAGTPPGPTDAPSATLERAGPPATTAERAGRPMVTVAPAGGWAPRPVLVGLLGMIGYFGLALLPGWPGIAVAVAVAAVAGGLVARWSGRAGWGQRHVLAAASASLVVAAGFAYAVPTYAPATPTAALVGDVAISVVTLTVVSGAWWRLRRPTSADLPPAG
ncbi:hypothetical protein DLJ47_11430 [Micromonospora sp. S4605]|uniref:hypothetical protein n=1 Tax=Micromonospora sp. S4605 TaxID=1420897 RepID=UPI000D70358E|nr:hypothetical protein [Micromonospora sp. S4605]PWU54891.1 hypothetical protein DLJ47_11430 [Micromonospora sp. S4605]